MRRQKFVTMAVLSLALAGVAFAVHDQALFELDDVSEVATMVAEATLSGSTALAETVDDVCMQDLAGFGLNCTANDVQIATAEVLEITDPCEFEGDTVTFTARFDVVVTAKERFDLGLYFATDGDPNLDGAISGECSVSNIDPTDAANFVDLDDFPTTGDSCGDITKKSNPLQPVITITTECIDPDGNQKLNLPNCTSWRQSGANELCISPLAAFPGSPSKCRCDVGFEVDVPVPVPDLIVDKVANPVTTGEPGGEVVFTVTVTNQVVDPNNVVTVNSVNDDIHGDVSATCLDLNNMSLVGQQIPAAQSLTCSFTATVSGDAGFIETDTVTVSGTDNNNKTVSGFDPATVTITDELPMIAVTKDANKSQVSEGGEDVLFTVVVTNNSVETVDITFLDDTVYGDIGATCLDTSDLSLIGQTIPANGGSLTCTFTAIVGAGVPGAHMDVVTATAVDNEDNEAMASDHVDITINNEPSVLSLTKTPNPNNVDEPGADVDFTVLVTNGSETDSVTIDSLTDNIHGDLSASCVDGNGLSLIGQTIPVGGSLSCTFTALVDGQGNTSETDTVTVTGTDDDGDNPPDATGSATVNINNVEPTAALIKIATQAVVTYKVSVTNTSVDGDPLMVQMLNDTPYGDVADAANPNVSNNTCPGLKEFPIQPGGTVMCTFDAVVTSDPSGEASVTDTVEGVLTDDEDAEVTPPPEDSATVTLTQ